MCIGLRNKQEREYNDEGGSKKIDPGFVGFVPERKCMVINRS